MEGGKGGEGVKKGFLKPDNLYKKPFSYIRFLNIVNTLSLVNRKYIFSNFISS